MKEHYISDKVKSLNAVTPEQIFRMERNRTRAELSNKLAEHIEKVTTEFQQQLCGYICHVIDKELSTHEQTK